MHFLTRSVPDAGNGTIDRTELQLLAFNLGRLMNDLELESAFNELDADGSGSIDFDELFAWLNSTEAGTHKGSAQAALRASLTRRMISRRAKAMKSRLDSVRKSGGKAAQGSIDLDVAWSWGAKALAEAAGPDAFRVKVTVDGSGKTAQLQDTSAQEGERAALQLFMKLNAGVTDEEVAAVVGPLNAFMADAIEAVKADMDDLPVSRATIVGPLPLPASADSGGVAAGAGQGGGAERCIALEVFVTQDPIKPALQAFEEFAEMAGGGSSDGAGDLTALVQKLIERFEVTLSSSQSLQQLLGQVGAPSASSSTLLTVQGKLAKSVLSVFQEMSYQSLLEDTAGSFSEDAETPFTMVQHAMAVNNLTLDAEVSDEERLAAAGAAALLCLRDSDEFKPFKTGAHMGGGVDPMAMVRAVLVRGMATLLLPMLLEDTVEAMVEDKPLPDSYREIQYLLTGKPEGFASAAAAQDESKDVSERGWRVLAWAVQWFLKHASVVHCIRVAGKGLGVEASPQGLDLVPLAQAANAILGSAVSSMTKVPPGEEEAGKEHVQMRTPVVLVAGAEPVLMDAAIAWAATSGTEDCDDAFEQFEAISRRVLVLPSGMGAVFDAPDDYSYKWRSALSEGNTAVLAKAFKEDDNLMELWVNDSCKLRHKPRCIAMGVLRASDVPQLTGAGDGDGMPSKGVQMTGRLMGSLLHGWEEHMEVASIVADSDAKRARLQPWAAVIIHEDVPVSAAAKAGAAALLQEELELPQGIGQLRVLFANLASGSGLLHGLDQLVAEAVQEHEATMEVFGPEEERD